MPNNTIVRCEYFETASGWAYRIWNEQDIHEACQYWTEPAVGAGLSSDLAFQKCVEHLIQNGKVLACVPKMTD